MAENITQDLLNMYYDSGVEEDQWTATQGWVFIVMVKPQSLDVVPGIRYSVYRPQFKGYIYSSKGLIPVEFFRLY